MQSKYPKILVISAWYPNSLHEAEGDFVREQSRLMHQNGIDIQVFHASLSIRYLLKGIVARREYKSSLGLNEYVIEMPYWPRNNFWGIIKWAKKFKSEIINYCSSYGWPDIIHAHTYLGGYIASLIKEEKGLPYLVTLHESYILSNKIPKHHFNLYDKAMQKADQVVTVGKDLALSLSNIENVGPITLPNFIDFSKFQISKNKFDDFAFIFIGELIERKGVDLLIESFGHIAKIQKKSQLYIVGDGPLLHPLKRKAHRLRSKDSVHFMGRLKQKELPNLLSRCHCLVLPSKRESFGIVLAEAMACGLPFISTRSGVPEDWFDHDGCKFINYDSTSLKEAMLNIQESFIPLDPEEIRQDAYEKFSAEVVISKYRKLYSSII